ncbi:MAG: HlyD family efflux transporter periplasmic adaptor subunit [Gammaproteobacteria bacterium]|nr:MAG: HlyD family efflux transporter periplasmic adaptor subunit [Gammaproteobacteria bacterium]
MQVRFRPAQRSPEELDGIKIPYAAGKGKAHKLAWYLILLAVLSPILYLSTGLAGAWLSLTANGTVFLEQQEVRAAQAGTVTRLDVKVGDALQTGQTVLVLDNFELTAAAARNAVERHAPAAAHLNAAAQAAMEEVRLRERSLQYHQERRATIQTLVGDGLAVNTLGTDTADIERSVLESRRRSMTHHAPFSGRVLEVLVSPGQYVSAGEPLVVVARLDNPHVVAYTPPKFGTLLQVGTRATIRFPDGTQTLAVIAEQPKLTQRMPSDLVDQFGLRPMTVVLTLLPQEKWPEHQRVQGLPVSVRFHYDWESSGLGRSIGALLGRLSR